MTDAENVSARRSTLSPAKRALLEKRLNAAHVRHSDAGVIPRRPGDGPACLSFAQERLWYLQQLMPESVAYNGLLVIRFTGKLDVSALNRTLTELVRRHETLRTSFPLDRGRPVQLVHPPYEVAIPLVDLQSTTPAQRRAEADRLIRDFGRQPFDVARGPLTRWTLLRLADDEHIFVQGWHHIIHDGWSNDVVLMELQALYQAFSTGRPSPLPEPSLQFTDFAVWQRDWAQGPALESQIAYWKDKLADCPPLNLPADRSPSRDRGLHGGRQVLELSPRLVGSLRELGRRQGSTLFMTMLAAFVALLHRYTGQEDLGVGTGIANRRLRQAEGLIGMIVNTLVLRVDLSGDPTFEELLGRVRQVALEAYANQDVPFDRLVQILQPDRSGFPDSGPT